MRAEQVILSRGLPKTGETIEAPVGCDGFYQAGWWVGEKVNGHRERLIAKTIAGGDVVIDRATGLMWAADGAVKGCAYNASLTWALALQYIDDFEFAGFSDWRVPNIRELSSIVDYVKFSPSIKEPPFANTYNGVYWSSTTDFYNLSNALGVDFGNFAVAGHDKTMGSMKLRLVRGV